MPRQLQHKDETSETQLTQHAFKRMQQRGLSETDIQTVIRFGRKVKTKAAEHRVMGRREVKHVAPLGFNFSAIQDVHVVVAPDGRVITAYKNADLKGIRHQAGCSRHRPQHRHQ